MPVVVTEITDADFEKIRTMFAVVERRLPKFGGTTRLIEGVYDFLIREKAEKNLTWLQVADVLTAGGYEISVDRLHASLSKIRKKRALLTAKPTGNQASRGEMQGLSIRSVGRTHGKQMREVIRRKPDDDADLGEAKTTRHPPAEIAPSGHVVPSSEAVGSSAIVGETNSEQKPESPTNGEVLDPSGVQQGNRNPSEDHLGEQTPVRNVRPPRLLNSASAGIVKGL